MVNYDIDKKQNCHIINKPHNKNLDWTKISKYETKSHSKYDSQNQLVKIEKNLSNVKSCEDLILVISMITKCKSFYQDFTFSTHLIQNCKFLSYCKQQ